MEKQKNTNLKLKNSIYKLSVISFIVVVVWIGFEIYFSYNQPVDDVQITRQLQPISPHLYLDLIESLEQRLTINPQELEAFKTTAVNQAIFLQAKRDLEKTQGGRRVASPPATSSATATPPTTPTPSVIP